MAANQVKADIGGNLNIESLQDRSSYTSQQSSSGASLSVSITGVPTGGGISASKSNIDSNYQSVTQQSGIKTGDGGFQVDVAGNTDLKGAVIASTDKAVDDRLNTFTTGGSLTTSDIQNTASYSGKSTGISINVGQQAGKYDVDGVGVGTGSDKRDASSATSSATSSGISGIAANTAVRSTDPETGIASIFDADKVQREVNAQVAITQYFRKEATKAGAQFAQDQLNKANALMALADLETDPAKKAGLQKQAEVIEADWKEGGPSRILMHAGIGLMGGGLNGATGAAASAAVTPQLSQWLEETTLNGTVRSGILLAAGTAIGSLVGGNNGAAAGLSEISNNGLGTVIKRVGIPAIVACLKVDSCRALTGVVGAAIALQAAKIMQDNPSMSEDNAYTIAATDLSNYGLAGRPATPLPSGTLIYTPAQVQQQLGSPPLNSPTELKIWLGNALDGYPAEEATKWARDFINTLPAAQQLTISDLIMQSVQDNAIAGSRRERKVRADLQVQYPNANIQDQQYLRDKNGNIAIDPNTGTARRLDHVVVVNGKVVDVVETTSLTASKDGQIEHESETRKVGGIYIRDRNTGALIEVPTISHIERRL